MIIEVLKDLTSQRGKKGIMFFSLVDSRCYEMFVKGYFTANILYKPLEVDDEYVIIDKLYKKLQCEKEGGIKSWGYYLLYSSVNRRESIERLENVLNELSFINESFYQYSFLDRIREFVAEIGNYKEVLMEIIKNRDFLGFVDAKDLESFLRGFELFGRVKYEQEIVYLYHNPDLDLTFFSLNNKNFREFVHLYIKEELIIVSGRQYAISSYCNLLAGSQSLEYMCNLLNCFLDDDKRARYYED